MADDDLAKRRAQQAKDQAAADRKKAKQAREVYRAWKKDQDAKARREKIARDNNKKTT